MTTKMTTQLAAFLLITIFAFATSFSFAHAHGDEVHETTGDDSAKIEKMQKMIVLLPVILLF